MVLCEIHNTYISILWSIVVFHVSCFCAGILSHRWRLLFTRIVAEPPKVVILVKAMCVLHNYLLTTKDQRYTPPGFVDMVEQVGTIKEGFWRQSPLGALGADGYSSRSATQEANAVRQHLVEYFSSEAGSVPWQLCHVNART